MAVTKRTRYEVLRRDGHKCRYCGAKAEDSPLTVDHVVPVALGGSDDPSNLVAACRDCNAGKSSTSPDAELVEDVTEDALRWSQAMQIAAEHRLREVEARNQYVRTFLESWEIWDPSLERLPPDFDAILTHWYGRHVPAELLTDAVGISWTRPRVPVRDKFRYLVGIVRNQVADMEEAARELIEEAMNDGT